MRPVCLITGSGGWLGNALCHALMNEYNIIAAYRTKPPSVPSNILRPIDPNRLTSEQSSNSEVYCIQGDLEKREDIRRVVEVSVAKFGKIDVLINSAADVHFYGKLIELWQSGDYSSSQLFLNSIAPMLLTSLVFEKCWKDHPYDNRMSNRNVVNISSMASYYVDRDNGQAFYAASKAALNMLTRYLAIDLAPYSVRANAICPGRLSNLLYLNNVVKFVHNLIKGNDSGKLISDFKG